LVDSLQKETSVELKKTLDITSRTTTTTSTTTTVRRFPKYAFKRPSLICTATFPRYTRIGHPTDYKLDKSDDERTLAHIV
jgi:hypothetical protein